MFKNVTLEVSLKPFKKTDDTYIDSVCEMIFRQWYMLLKDRKTVSILLWTADGSEILDYTGDLSDSFEWCQYMGTANRPLADETDRDDLCIHTKKRLYTENPPVMTYELLKKIVAAFKKTGKHFFPDATITVGETFDIGPEFAVSDFKYRRHTEILNGKNGVDDFGFVDSTACLAGDDRSYAAYPNGIPDGTPFGLFLGKQANVFLADMGFDYLWLSNGLGFSADPWTLDGKIFDGKNFYPQRLQKTADEVFSFWKYFRKGCPDYPVETRGTNNSVGIDYVTDGVPLYDIYNGGFNITPPPNSPWAALNDDFGLELMGHMTRICGYPNKDFLFRFYIHDPWWINTPWYDRYECNPHDIYMPMAVSRLNEAGKPESPEIFNILSIDNSYGDMPDCCVTEPLPHILKAEKESPDDAAPFVWVYPMREYSTAEDETLLSEMYYGDTYIKDAINAGFPLNCVVSTDNFLKTPDEAYSKSILISPPPVETAVKGRLEDLIRKGITVICYADKTRRDTLPNGCRFVDMREPMTTLFAALADCGYEISHKALSANVKVPTMTVARFENGYFFSVYNTNTTTETHLRFPLGSPIFLGGETELRDGKAVYRFARSEHRECRFFVVQKNGVVGAHERTSVNAAVHRRIKLSGLSDATVYFFPETENAENVRASLIGDYSDRTPEYDDRWQIVRDEKFGTYLYAEHVTGTLDFFMMRQTEHGKSL